MAVKQPSKCPECEATDIKSLGASAFSFINEGKNEQAHAVTYACNNCGHLMFKLPN